MANANIFAQFARPVRSMAEYGADYDAAEGNKLALAAKRMQMQQAERGQVDQQTARTAYASSGGDAAKYRNALVNAGLYQEVQALDAAGLKTRETEADIGLKGANARKAGVDADKDQLAMASQKIDIAGKAFGFVRDNPSAENAQRVVQSLMQGGIWNQQQADKAMAEIQANPTPEAIKALATQAFQQTLAAKDQLPQYFQQNRGGTQAVLGVNPVTGQTSDVQTAQVTQSEAQRLQLEQQAREAAAGRAVTMRGQNMTDQRAQDRLNLDKTKPAGAAKTGPMSVTLQKELLEADDTVQSAGNVVNTLKSALKINDKAYSGYFAKGRAQVVSNLGGTDSADATIDIDNMMTGQALESLKVVFGGMPTEGERKILLDMQASADKTPDQRKAIMERAIKAAERRAQYAGSKAKAIRGGTYLTEGADPIPDAPTTPGASSPEDAQAREWATKNPNDPRSKKIMQRLGGG